LKIINDTIVAAAGGVGGAIGVVRVSGAAATTICDAVFRATGDGGALVDATGYSIRHGEIYNPADRVVIDDVLVTVFRAPRSYTGEDSVEISCHGSPYIQRRIIELLIGWGARAAEPGEFTLRAFLNGKLDLSQAEAVADLIASTDRASHDVATRQMRGGYSAEFTALRAELLTLVSLLELELDFGEEDVEFADRARLAALMGDAAERIDRLARSFSYGNALREGFAVAIAGAPNVGKSTLLNALVHDDRALVSDIPGTTRDVVEESIVLSGIRFRFLDTAGIRATDDRLEQMGIERTRTSVARAHVVLVVVTAGHSCAETIRNVAETLGGMSVGDRRLCIVVNKIDASDAELPSVSELATAIPALSGGDFGLLPVSAKFGTGIERLADYLVSLAAGSSLLQSDTIVSNARHYEALVRAAESLARARTGLSDGLTPDFLAQDIREVLHHLGTITGEITTPEILANIFSKFCIGK